MLALLLYFFLLEAIDIRSGLLRVGKVATVTSMAILGLIDLVPAVSAPAAAAIGLTPNMSWGQANVMMAGQISISPLIGATFAMGDRAGSLGYFLRNDSGLCRPKGLSRTSPICERCATDRRRIFLPRCRSIIWSSIRPILDRRHRLCHP